MDDQIICPSCKTPIPLTQAISHQAREVLQKEREEEKKKFEEERKKMIFAAQKWKEEQSKKLEEEHHKIQKELESSIKLKMEKEIQLSLQDSKNEAEELQKQNKSLHDQLLEMNRLMRQIRTESEQKHLELEKKLGEEQEKMREDAQKRADEEYHLKMLEKDKKINDALKLVEEYKRKIEQGSQQTQGEVLELEIENILKREFPFDEIKPVAKGERGADILQIVKNNYGRACGSIIWEFKRTKAWSSHWVGKLKDDQREIKAELAVLISQVLPPDIKSFGNVDDVWIGEYACAVGLATALRSKLIEVAMVKMSAIGKNEKMEVLYKYLSGIEFKQRVEAIVETITSLQDDLEKEKQWFTRKWAKQEKNMRKVVDNTIGMHGDLQGIMGKALAEINGLEILPDEEESTPKLESKTNTLFE